MNFSEIKKETGGLGVLPEGRYSLEVEDTEIKRTSTNKDMMVITYKVLAPDDFSNRKVWDQFVLEGKSLMFLYLFLEAANYPELEEDKDTSNAELAKKVKGLQVSAYLKSSTGNNGKPRNEVTGYADISTPPAITDEEYNKDDTTSSTSTSGKKRLFD